MEKDTILYERRVGIQLLPGPISFARIMVSWPFGKITVFKDRIVLNVVWQDYVIPFSSIKKIEKLTFTIKIDHTLQNMYKFVNVGGPIASASIFRELKSVIKNNHIDVNI